MPKYVSTAEVSAALGVSVSTVKRWVDRGVLGAHKTAGGHRKLLLADVVRLAREQELPHANLSRLLAADETPHELPQNGRMFSRMVQALRGGDEPVARELILSSYKSGRSIARIADELVAPAMRSIGDGWECGELDVMHEHRATQVCAAALFELRSELENARSADNPVAVIGTPERDPYVLAALSAEMTLVESGWNAVNLGPNTPFDSFEQAIVELKPKLTCLSVSYLADRDAFVERYLCFAKFAEDAGVAVAIGGREFDDELKRRLPRDCFAASMVELADFAKTLRPIPAPPRRGRPPKTEETT